MSELTLTTGCTAFGFDLDGDQVIDMNDAHQKVLLEKVINKIQNDGGSVQDILQTLVETYGEWDSEDGSCDQCGDFVSWYKLEL